MKIYTKTGDDGTTGLIGGRRVSKADGRIACVGALDEINAAIGWAGVVAAPALLAELRQIQNDLFVIGSHVAAAGERAAQNQSLPPLEEEMIIRLEKQIDAADAQLPPLRNFILPGGGETAARLHLARAVCRRAETRIVGSPPDASVAGIVSKFVNRLSDWLFVQARLANHLEGIADVLWEKAR